MKDILEKCSASSALFLFYQGSGGGYQLAFGSKGRLIGEAVEVLHQNGLGAMWVYVCSWLKSNGCIVPELFQLPISADTYRIATDPSGFFGELNPPGLVVSPFAAINLSLSVETVLVLRDAQPKVFKTDVMEALDPYVTVHDKDTQSVVTESAAERMALRIGTTVDIGKVNVGGKAMYLSISANALQPAEVD